MADNDLVLVTGASGFVAKHVIKEALARGFRVRGTLRRPAAAGDVRKAVGEAGDMLSFVSADLLKDDGWAEAVSGCRHVLHVASPFPLNPPKDPNALIPAARDGSLRVLRAAAAAGVERTVVTSSCVAIWYGHAQDAARVFTEADWTRLDSPATGSYARSKTVAERAAWDFVAAEGRGMALAVINPSWVLGPPLDADVETSGQSVLGFLRGKYPGVPDFGYEAVDVRDVALAHLEAMVRPEAAGRRFIASAGPLKFRDLGRALAEAFPDYRSRMPRFTIPNALVRVMALVDPGARSVLPDLGPVRRTSHQAAEEVLGIRFRPPEEALTAMARGLIEMGLV